jgi:hypothetical protein
MIIATFKLAALFIYSNIRLNILKIIYEQLILVFILCKLSLDVSRQEQVLKRPVSIKCAGESFPILPVKLIGLIKLFSNNLRTANITCRLPVRSPLQFPPFRWAGTALGQNLQKVIFYSSGDDQHHYIIHVLKVN